MKINVNYDLLEKIHESKKGLKLQKVLARTCLSILPFTMLTIVGLIPVYYLDKKFFYIISSAYAASKIISPFALKLMIIKNKRYDMIKAKIELLMLEKKLHDLEVRTTTELLKESKVIKTSYRLAFSDDKLPVLRQEKYITIPLSNGYEQIFLQEHNIGSKNYELSGGNPAKSLKYRKIKATN